MFQKKKKKTNLWKNQQQQKIFVCVWSIYRTCREWNLASLTVFIQKKIDGQTMWRKTEHGFYVCSFYWADGKHLKVQQFLFARTKKLYLQCTISN